MKQLTVEQQFHAQRIITGTKTLRQSITLYKKSNPGLALFRTQAMNHIQHAVLAVVLHRKLPASTKNWLQYWGRDQGIGQNITELFRCIANDF